AESAAVSRSSSSSRPMRPSAYASWSSSATASRSRSPIRVSSGFTIGSLLVVSLGEDLVELAAGLGEHLLGPGELPRAAAVDDLHQGRGGPAGEVEQLGPVLADVRPHVLPGSPQLVAVLRDVGAAGLGEPEGLLALRLLRDHQPFVRELLERRVDRAGAGLPAALAAFGDLLDDLVAVAGLLGEEREDRRADVPALGLPASGEPPRAELEPAPERGERPAPAVPMPVTVPAGRAPVPPLTVSLEQLVPPHASCPLRSVPPCVSVRRAARAHVLSASGTRYLTDIYRHRRIGHDFRCRAP